MEELADILGIEEDFLRRLSFSQYLHLIEACKQAAGISTLTFTNATGRTMRVIVASSYVDETDVDTYKANPYTIGLARPELESTIKYWSVLFDPLRMHLVNTTRIISLRTNPSILSTSYNHHPNVLLTAPRFFAKEGYCAPQTTHTPCHVARNTNLDQFSWMREHPRPLEEFNTWMSAQELRLPAWTEWFPVRDHLLQSNDLNQDEILLVDVAGGIGQDLKAFQGRYPDAKGRLILQDMEKVVAQAVKDGLPDGIEAMAIDLFDPQPVQGTVPQRDRHNLSTLSVPL